MTDDFVSVIAKVRGRYCCITANDGTVKGGTYFPITVTKALRAQHVSSRMVKTFHARLKAWTE